jgi:hypothetical protein
MEAAQPSPPIIRGEELMRKLALALLFVAAPVTALQAQAMPVSTFLAKAGGLEKKGMMALFSSDIRVLKKEIQQSALAVRNEQIGARKAGRRPASCMPDSIKLNSKELLDYLRSIPAPQRAMPIRQAFQGFASRKYPCPA